jgi:hypothetical protein
MVYKKVSFDRACALTNEALFTCEISSACLWDLKFSVSSVEMENKRRAKVGHMLPRSPKLRQLLERMQKKGLDNCNFLVEL